MSISIKNISKALDDAMDMLIQAAGNDPFLSMSDIEELLEKSAGAEKKFLGSLIELARNREMQPEGRITVTDLKEMSRWIRKNIFPAFHILPGELSGKAKIGLKGQGDLAIDVATLWKSYAIDRQHLEASELIKQLKALLEGLNFTSFFSSFQPISVHALVEGPETLDATSFVDALLATQQQVFEDKAARIGKFISVESPAHFLDHFPTYQKPEHTDRAKTVVELLQTHLSQLVYLRFDNEYLETTTFFVAGLTDIHEIVFLEYPYVWE